MRTPAAVVASVLESVIVEPATWREPSVRARLVKSAQSYMCGVGMPVEQVGATYDSGTGALTMFAVDGDFEIAVSITPRKR